MQRGPPSVPWNSVILPMRARRRYATVKFGFFVFQRLTFLQQRAVRRVNFGVQLGDFRLFKGQFVQLRIDVHHRIEHRFCFQRQINRIFILTEGIQFVFGNIQAVTYFRYMKASVTLCLPPSQASSVNP